MSRALARALCLAALAAVASAQATPASPAAATMSAQAPNGASPRVLPWPLPAPDGAAWPDLVATPEGGALLAWTARTPGGHALEVAEWRDGAWRSPLRVAEGADWFVNWADVPHVAALPDGQRWAQWLRRSADAPYAYDVWIRRFDDGAPDAAATPRLLHDDGTATEHGFVAVVPQADGALGLAWLDGRATAGGAAHGGHGGHGADAHGRHAAEAPADDPADPDPPIPAAMTVRGARVLADGRREAETLLDRAACDCCTTDAAMTARGAVLVYRDRRPGERRDIALVRQEPGGWTRPRAVGPDGWITPGCPVNGPAVAARGERVWVGWYTEAGGAPSLRLARSEDAGDVFGAPLQVDAGPALLGRVDVAADAGGVYVAWLREDAEGQALWLGYWTAAADPGFAVPAGHVRAADERWRLRVATLAGRGRATGFPKLLLLDGVAHLAWTEVVDGAPRLRGARVDPR